MADAKRVPRKLWLCYAPLQLLVADESSYRCTQCAWIGWPHKDVDPVTGRVLKIYPHARVAPRVR